MPYQLGLPAALKARGLVVEVVPGWETRGASGLNPRGALCHWTAGPKNKAIRPSLSICVNGRSDLPGPLCNVFLDRNGVAVVVAAGIANHAGAGNWKGLTSNSQLFGTEAECGGDGDWTKAQQKAYPRVNAAYCDLGKFGAEMIGGHNEHAPTRKIDIRDWPMSAMRSQVSAVLSGSEPSEEDDMFSDTDREALSYVKGLLSWAFDPTLGAGPAFGQAGELTNTLRSLEYAAIPEGGVNSRGEAVKRLRLIQSLVSDPAAFAEAVADRLPDSSGGGGGLTKDDVRGAIRDVLGSLDAG